MLAFLQILKTETLNPKSEEKQGDLEKSKPKVAKELRSNLPRLWLALSFHKITPIVAILFVRIGINTCRYKHKLYVNCM